MNIIHRQGQSKNININKNKMKKLEFKYLENEEELLLQESVRIAYEILNKNATDFEIQQLAINMCKNALIEDTVNLIFVWNTIKRN